VGVDVAAAGQRLTHQGVGFTVGAGEAGVDADVSGQGGGGVERGDANGVGDQLCLEVMPPSRDRILLKGPPRWNGISQSKLRQDLTVEHLLMSTAIRHNHQTLEFHS
jgi:hypothetical protein